MKKELILKSSVRLYFALAIYATFAMILMCAIGFFFDFVIFNKSDHKYTGLIIIVFACIISFFWVIFLASVIFASKIIVTEDAIKAEKFGKQIWIIQKIEIKECLYQELRWWHFLIPMAAINSGALQFKMLNKTISRHSCSLSRKQVDKIKKNFDYPFREINSIYEH